MAKNAWGDERAAESPRDWGDKPVGEVDLPADVAPSTAGAGRGRVNPDPVEPGVTVHQGPVDTSDPLTRVTPSAGSTNPTFALSDTLGSSVLRGKDMPEPQFDPAEANRLSRRGYAETALLPDDPRRTAPSFKPDAGTFVPTGPRTAGGIARDVAATAVDLPLSAASTYADVSSVLTGGVVGPGAKKEIKRAQTAVQEKIGTPETRQENADLGRAMADDSVSPVDVVKFMLSHPVLLGQQSASAVASFALPLNVVKVAKVLGVVMTPARATQIAMAANDLMNAGQTFNDTDAGLAGKYGAAAIAGIGSHAVGMATGGGAEGALARAGAGQKLAGVREAVTSSLLKEPTQEYFENASQAVGQDIGEGKDINLGSANKQGVLGALVAPLGAGAMSLPSTARPGAQQQSATDLARAKGFLVDADARIKALRSAGENNVADVLEKRVNTVAAETELPHFQGESYYTPAFEQNYRSLRSSGIKPAEAGSRAAMFSGFTDLATQAGMTPKAIQAAVDAASKKPIDEVPAFLDRFTATITGKGMGTPVQAGTVAEAVGGAGDAALGKAVDALYGEKSAAVDKIAQLVGAPAEAAPEAATEPTAPEATADEALSVDHGAHEAASSPLNSLPEPTKPQILAGNAKLGHIKIGPLDISVENPDASIREDKHNTPPQWQTEMQGAHYGYVKRSQGADGDQVDVFVKAGTPESYAGPVYVIDQIDPKTGKFDEHKAILGAANQHEASDLYHRHYEQGWMGAAHISEFQNVDAFNAWVKSGTLTEPLGADAKASEVPAPSSEKPQVQQRSDGADRQDGAKVQPDAALSFTRNESGTLTVKGDADALTKMLADNGVTRVMRGKAGVLVGKTDADKAEKLLAKMVPKQTKAAPVAETGEPLRLGMTPSAAEPVTVKNGVVHVGKSEALNFDSGEPIRVADGATHEQIKQALKDGGAVSKRAHFYGGSEKGETISPLLPKAAEGASSGAATEESALKAGDFKGMLRLRKEREARELAAIGDVSNGAVLRHQADKRWVMVLPDVDGGGKWRIQRFDAKGFSGHMVFNTKQEAVESARGEGFKTRDDQALDRMQDTPEFQRGEFASDLIRQINGGTLDHATADKRLSEYDAKAVPTHKEQVKPAEPAPVVESIGKSGPERSKAGDRSRARAREANPFKAFLGEHGIQFDSAKKNDYTLPLTERRRAIAQGFPPIFRRAGMPMDKLAQAAVDEGFLLKPDTAELANLIDKTLTRGERVDPQYSQAYGDRLEAEKAQADFPESDFIPSELEESGYVGAGADVQARVRALVAQADAAGLNAESLLEDVARVTENATEQTYYDAAEQALIAALAREGSRGAAHRSAASGRESAPAGEAQGLTAPTKADILAQQAQREAEAQRQQDGGDKPAKPRPTTADQIDLLNPQGGIFDAPEQPTAPAKPKAEAVQAPEAQKAPEGGKTAQELNDIPRNQTNTEAFRKWFGESKVVDAEGKPLVVYHGSKNDISEFKSQSQLQRESGQWLQGNEGIYFTNDHHIASVYGDAVYPTHLSIRNPFIVGDGTKFEPNSLKGRLARLLSREKFSSAIDAQKLRDEMGNSGTYISKDDVQELSRMGYDGVLSKSAHRGADVWIAFRPEQIKSAIGNRGTFDATDPNIAHDFSKTAGTLSRIAQQGYEKAEVPRVQAARRLTTLLDRFDNNKISDGMFQLELKMLAHRMSAVSETKQANRTIGDRERGADLVREKLIRARRQGDLDNGTVEFALWLLDKNPDLAEGLGMSVRSPGEGASSAGRYNPASRVMTLFKGSANEGTAVHEILHHSERMMPKDVQKGINDAWAKAFSKAYKDATPEQRKALDKMAEAMAGSKTAHDEVVKSFSDGVLDYDQHYQLTNPSEFWAVNATRIMAARNEAQTWVRKAKQWLGEMVQKAKGAFGLASDAPILKGLQAVLDGDGSFQSKKLLSQANELSDVAQPAATNDRPDLSPWKDASGRLQFAPGAWLYDKMGKAAGPLLAKVGLKPMSKELSRQLRQMNLAVAKAQETAASVAGEAMKLSEDERGMVSDLIEQELAAGTIPPEHAVRLAAVINGSMNAQTDELVRLGMLSKDSADMWRGKYLPRYYKSKLSRGITDAWADAVGNLRRKPKSMVGIKGKHLKGRGLYETIAAADLPQWEELGWQVRDPEYDKSGPADQQVAVWRDFTREERDSMGEIRDAGFRFVMGYMQTQRDIALGKMFEAMATDAEMSSKRATDKFTVRVPDGTIEGTGAKRYGMLAGRYVAQETLSHLSQIEEASNGAWRMYRQVMAYWKSGKTVFNPVAHFNNVVSNLSMANFAGIGYHRFDKYFGAAKDFATKGGRISEANDAGLFLGTLSDAELMETLPEELRALVQEQDSPLKKIGRTAFDVMTFFTRKPLSWAYKNEDTFFSYMLYKDARERGLEPSDAVDWAHKFIFTYDDLPKGARRIRDFGIPFFAYTYKAIPALAETALKHPIRFLTPAAILAATNAMSYAFAVGGDDDDWLDTIRKMATDADFRAKALAKEDEERKMLPTWMRGTTALFTPRAIRLGMDKISEMPLFLDVSRIIPGGDLFDASPNAAGVPWLQPFTPSHPIFTTAVAMFGNKDMYFGKDIVDMNDTSEEATRKRLGWLWRQMSPALSYGNYHFERAMNAVAQATGHEVKWLPEVVNPDAIATGIGNDGNPTQPKLAAMQSIGIKVRPIDMDMAEQIDRSSRDKMLRDIDAEMRKLSRLATKGAVSERAYERAYDNAQVKKDRLHQGQDVNGNEKN